MSESCCDLPASTGAPDRCPSSGDRGRTVDWLTVAALTRIRVPRRQEFRLCPGADCEVVYYGEHGETISRQDLVVEPGFKEGGDLVCYCFLHCESELRAEIEATGSSDVVERIKREVEAGNCACEVRNPSGTCCLGDVAKVIREIEAERAAVMS